MLALSVSTSFTPSCPQSSQWFARCGTLNNTHQNAYDAMICGLNSDGVWSTLDAFYVFCTQNTTAANLNLVSASYPITAVGSPVFTADTGYTGGADSNTTVYLDTGFNPNVAGGHYTQNSATIALWSFSTVGYNGSPIGIYGSSTSPFPLSQITPLYIGDGNAYFAIASPVQGSLTSPGATGSWFAVRDTSATLQCYHNGSNISANVSSNSSPLSLTNMNHYILARNSNAGATGGPWIVPVAAFGGSWTATQALAFHNRVAAYLDATHGSH
jgi:hypothetical protein